MDRVAMVHHMQRVFEGKGELTDLRRFHLDSPHNMGVIAKPQSTGLHSVLWPKGSPREFIHFLHPSTRRPWRPGVILPWSQGRYGRLWVPREGHNDREFQLANNVLNLSQLC